MNAEPREGKIVVTSSRCGYVVARSPLFSRARNR